MATPYADLSGTGWRRIVAGAMRYSGLLRLSESFARSHNLRHVAPGMTGWKMQKITGTRAVILCYHGVGSNGFPVYSDVPTRVFEAQICYLRDHYRIVSLDQLRHELREGGHGRPAIVITFDDGYRNTYTNAFPVLRKYQIPATVYLTVDCIETGKITWYDYIFVALQVHPAGLLDLRPHIPGTYQLGTPAARLSAGLQIMRHLRTLPNSARQFAYSILVDALPVDKCLIEDQMMTWSEVKQMQSAGIRFGSHTMTHPVVSRLQSSEMQYELGKSKSIIEQQIGDRVVDFSFPFGQSDDCGNNAAALAGRFGYLSAVTSIAGTNVSGVDPVMLRRSSLVEESSLSLFALRLSYMFARGEDELTSRGPVIPAADEVSA